MPDAETSRQADDRRRGALMASAQAGDQAAYQTLLRECVGLIQAIARRQGVPPDRVDDAVQETLLTIHKARHTYDPNRSFTGWLYAIAQRRAIDILRGATRHRAREVHAPVAYENYADTTAPADRGVAQAQDKVILGSAIAELPAGQREAVQRLVIEDRSLDEAAALTGRNKGALKVNLHRALKSLRARLGGGG
jgi:RNA polymerase sigma factor (sigma-70 family)